MSTYAFKLTAEEEFQLQENYPTELERILVRTALEKMDKLFYRGKHLQEEQLRIINASNDYFAYLQETTGAETLGDLDIGQLLRLQIFAMDIANLQAEIDEINKVKDAKYGCFLREMP